MAQRDSGLQLINIVHGGIHDFEADNLGNLYLVNANRQVKKLDSKFDSVTVFNDVRKYGQLYSIDATNPLKLLLFYRDFGTVLTLDRFLNVRNTIDLRSLNVFQVNAICQSFDNGIWVYDENAAKLRRFNDAGTQVDESNDFRQVFDSVPSPVYMADQDKLVYLYDPAHGLFIFDYFGGLKNKIMLLGWQDMQVSGGFVFGRKGRLLERYQPGTLQMQDRYFPDILTSVQKMRIVANRLYCLQNGDLYVYGLQ